MEEENGRESEDLQWLLDAFPSVTLEEIASVYSASNCDLNDTAHSLTALATAHSTLSNNDHHHHHSHLALKDKTLQTSKLNYNKKKKKNKKISVCAGSVSSVVGNGHSRAISIKSEEAAKRKKQDQERQLEEFLYAMMGDGWQLDMDVVRNVLSLCGYDVEKSLNRLLEMAAISSEVHYEDLAAGESSVSCSNEKDGPVRISFQAMSKSFPERDQDELLNACQSNLQQLKLSFPDLPENVLNEILESVNFSYSEARNILIEAGMESGYVGIEDKSRLPRQFLESLFNIKASSEKIPSNMDFVKAVRLKRKSKKMVVNTSLDNLSESTDTRLADGEEDEYELHRKIASQHWGTMKSYFQEAAAAYSMGQRARAGYLSAEGNHYKQLAREADEKASQRIFDVKNKDMHNDVTIDLHSQHVKDAIRLLKLHIQSLASISSIHSLKVITGCGSHGTGRGRIKRAVTQLLEKEGIEWSEENGGVIAIKIKNVNPESLSFVNADTD